MTTETIIAIIGGVLVCGGFWTFVQFLINRKDNKNDTLKAIKTKVDKIDKDMIKNEKDTLRTQMLLMIAIYPEETAEILELGKHYFVDLKGNWFATPIFNRWCKKHNIEPEWFDNDK